MKKISGLWLSGSVRSPLEGFASPLHTSYDGDLTSCKQQEASRPALVLQITSYSSSSTLGVSFGLNLHTSRLTSPRPSTFCCQSQNAQRQEAGAEVSAPEQVVVSLGLVQNPPASGLECVPCIPCTSRAPLG